MSDKVDFNGDVGQAVMGDVKEAPRLSNVVNLNLNEVKKEVKFITDYQRRRINILVKEWSAICGDEEIEIYKVFITDFGLQKFRDLPIEHYFDVKEKLEGWITGGAKAVKAPEPLPEIEPVEMVVKNEPYACIACTEKEIAVVRAQMTTLVLSAVITILAITCGWLLYKMPTERDSDSQQAETKCYFDGKAYSPGSMVRNVTGNLQECAIDDAMNMVRWIPVRKK